MTDRDIDSQTHTQADIQLIYSQVDIYRQVDGYIGRKIFMHRWMDRQRFIDRQIYTDRRTDECTDRQINRLYIYRQTDWHRQIHIETERQTDR